MNHRSKRALIERGEQLPPHDIKAEAGALACVLTANGQANDLFGKLDPEHFYDIRHKTAFSALRCLRIEGKDLSVVTLTQWLCDKKQIKEAGGMEYVSTLPDRTPSAAHFPAFFETVKDRATRRAGLYGAAEFAQLLNDTSIPISVVQDATRKMFSSYARSDRLPEIVDAATFVGAPIPRPPELVRNVVHKGSKLVLGGGSKSFKTWTLLDLAASVAHGAPWLNFETEEGRVLFVNFEIPDWSWRERIEAVTRAKGITLEKSRLSLLNLRGRAAGYASLLPHIRDAAKQNYSLIILDPIYKLYGGADENKAGDVAALLNATEELASATGAAVAFGAHFSKGNQAAKESIDRISGSGVFARDPDSLLVFTRHEVRDAFTIEATLRNFAPTEPFAVRWQYPLMVTAPDLDPAKLKQAGGRKADYSADDLLRLLSGSGMENKEWMRAAADEHGISDRSFYRLRRELTVASKVIRSVNGKWMPVKK